MIIKMLLAASASAMLLAGAAHAQTAPTQAPAAVPTRAECTAGYKAGEKRWTEAQFKDACAKVQTNSAPTQKN